jgi:glucose/arabinose dehydrogenase
MRRASLLFALPPLAFFAACGNAVNGGAGGTSSAGGTGGATATTTLPTTSSSSTTSDTTPDSGIADPCALPGSVQFTGTGTVEVPGNPSPVDLSFLELPAGFCAHYYATVGNARQLRYAPGGELFVASPTALTTGGGLGGLDAIVVLPDDDHDGVADAPVHFADGITHTQGMAFSDGFFYYQDDAKIMRVAYQPGDRKPSAAAVKIAEITVYYSALHWPKGIDVADDGTIFVTNGGDQNEACDPAHPFRGGILKLDGTPGGAQVCKGLRNPITIRCARGHDRCFALEMAKDYSATTGGREKMIPIRQGDDWGFPCCATKNLPYADINPTDCSMVTAEDVGFKIGDSPFGLAFAPPTWPATYAGSAIIANHGAAGTWFGARIVAIGMDPNTGLPIPGDNNDGADHGSMIDFATGWDDGTLMHGRPAALEMAPDGRLFVANDHDGVILWIAPIK